MRLSKIRMYRLGAVLLISGLLAAAPPAGVAGMVTVGAQATGGFGRSYGFAGGPSSGGLPLVAGWTFTAAGQMISISATGTINIADQYNPGPNGVPVVIDGVVAAPNSFTPLEQEAVLQGTLALPRPEGASVPEVGALMGAFVPAGTASNSNFVPADPATLVAPQIGIDPATLFLIGAGPYTFTSQGAGTLYLGINEWFPSNNTGSFTVSLSAVSKLGLLAVPEPGGLALAAGAGITIALAVGMARWREGARGLGDV